MDEAKLDATAEQFLFGRGLHLEEYFIEETPVSEVLCYRNADGREFDLPINDPELAKAVLPAPTGNGCTNSEIGLALLNRSVTCAPLGGSVLINSSSLIQSFRFH